MRSHGAFRSLAGQKADDRELHAGQLRARLLEPRDKRVLPGGQVTIFGGLGVCQQLQQARRLKTRIGERDAAAQGGRGFVVGLLADPQHARSQQHQQRKDQAVSCPVTEEVLQPG